MKGELIMIKAAIGKYTLVIRCTYYNKCNVPTPVYSGSFDYDLDEEFIGNDNVAVEHFKQKYAKRLEGPNSITVFQVINVYRKVMGV